MALPRPGRYAGAVGSRSSPRRCFARRGDRDAVQIGCGRARWAPGSEPHGFERQIRMGSVVKKRRKRMAKKKHRKLLRKTRVQRRRLGK
ncbi:hypothetical protein GCM10010172_26190 [Paractinoplanes ferrugineus]|uniref:Ribosomal protein mS38 C-terminal domain-containing protein n=147 Tax=Actinomycetes TaxID=1760 RepID=A0A919ISZ5_9ACTN|nr:hypothetical protein Afe05nite_03110 [Actinoplanes ferrugineus]